MLENVKEKMNAKTAAFVATPAAGVVALALPNVAFADEVSIDTVTTSMTTAFSGFATSALTAIGNIVPVVLPIMGAMVVVGIGVRVFKRFAK